ncbi:MAG: hypothetical protein A2Y12_04520 [Planctomycetes bacterium GWF2_42_9]|nr:MAG: hypothetical protein A2Y12_04520 [Planctomycetes bacterium GWF2_42_9]HAL45211.1 hypothetical protein [Phycisphaerales bacterium]
MKNVKSFVLAILLLVISTTASVYAVDSPDHMLKAVTINHIKSTGTTPSTSIGAFAYNPINGYFYTVTYGAGKTMRIFAGKNPINAYHPNLVSDGDGNSWEAVTESDLNRICVSPDVEGGVVTSYDAGAATINGIILNPAPMTINGYSYGAYQMAVLNNNNKAATLASTKRLLSWDLREIWSPTTQQPDLANAQFVDGMLEVDMFGPEYGYGCTNWNDCFRSLMSLGDLANSIGASPPLATTDQVGGRRSTFSTDASKVYFVSMQSSSPRQLAGVWSVETAAKTVHFLFNDTASASIRTCTEPAAIAIGTRNFTGLPYASGLNQVLFNGTEVSGNIGGINAIVDNGIEAGTSNPIVNPPVYKVVDGNSFCRFVEIDPDTTVAGDKPKVWSIITDAEGNIYFDAWGPAYVLAKYDTQGRFSILSSRLLRYSFNQFAGASASTTTATNLRLDTRMVPAPYNANEQILQVMSMATLGSASCVIGYNVYKPADFTRDGEVNVADMDFFKAQFKKSSGTLPLIADGQSYLDYIKADLNGTGILNTDKTGMAAACVTTKDAEILYQFVKPGDTNFDGKVDFVDFANLAKNFNQSEVKNWKQGDFDFDDNTDISDIGLLAENWLESYEL